MRGGLKEDDWGDYVGDEEGVSYGRLRQTKGEYGTPCALAETELAVDCSWSLSLRTLVRTSLLPPIFLSGEEPVLAGPESLGTARRCT